MKKVQLAIERAVSALIGKQFEDGHFEGKLSSNTYPSCAYSLIEIVQGKTLDPALIDWFLGMQTLKGLWRLDTSNRPDRECTSLARLILEQMPQNNQIVKAIDLAPEISPNSWMTKVFYALCNRWDWDDLVSSKLLIYPMKIMLPLMQILPESLRAKMKPAEQPNPPPVDLFQSSVFDKLFIAEQYTLVPIFLIIELNTKKRVRLVADLLEWLKEHVLSDGSWFRVGYITGVSVLALLEAQRHGYGDEVIESMIQKGVRWLESLRNPDGGIREAINLNVWDTALSVVALLACGVSHEEKSIKDASRWLIKVQNVDGGWAFSGMTDDDLPSDADDTALATLALLRSKTAQNHPSVAKAIRWLKAHQAKNGIGFDWLIRYCNQNYGCWGTYIPGMGDVGCVSITSHAIEAFLELDGFENEIKNAVKWLERKIDKAGYWSDLWLAKNTYGTASAIAAFIKAGRECDAISQGVDWLHRTQNPDGGWGEDMFGNKIDSTAEQTAWSSYALLLANPDDLAAKRGVDFLLEMQNEDGTWSPSNVGIYWEVLGGYDDPIYALVFPMLALAAISDA